MSTTEVVLTSHLVVLRVSTDNSILQRVSYTLHNRFGITHSTLQIERGEEEKRCKQACPESV